MRSIGLVTGGRWDYGICQPVLEQLKAQPDVRLLVFVSGAHLSPAHGFTVRRIEEDGWPIAERIQMLLSSDDPEGIATSMGIGTMGFARAFARSRPDVLLVVGDRFEMLAAASAALPFAIPLAHIHGGELSEGAIDDQIRHAITKMSHLHFVATSRSADRVIQMGEEPWRVTVSGAPSLDNLRRIRLLPVETVNARLGLPAGAKPIIVTHHPATLQHQRTAAEVDELVGALGEIRHPLVITAPNADTHNNDVRSVLRSFVSRTPNAVFVENLGTEMYFSTMACAAAMVGNSSSGIVEAASFRLPVVNVGVRQDGRERPANVIDVGASRAAILEGIREALSPAFAARLRDLQNPYGDGTAAARIVAALRSVALDDRLIVKRFRTMAADVGVGESRRS